MADSEEVLAERERYTRERLIQVREKIEAHLSPEEQARVLGDHTCVYATGSAGRLELSTFSDLDAFIVRDDERAVASELDAWLIQSAVLRASRALGFPEPDADGKFLRMHTLGDLLKHLGTPEDDVRNTFTARMLLLLEGRVLCGEQAHAAAVKRIVDTYWRHQEQHRGDYLPLALFNDIIRYWRIVLLNYEAKNAAMVAKLPDGDADTERRMRSYKLRISRCLLCHSAIAALLHEARVGKGHIERERVIEMVSRTPLERLAVIARDSEPDVQKVVSTLRDLYGHFLTETAQEKAVLLQRFAEREYQIARSREARDFRDSMAGLLEALGRDNPLFSYLLV